MKSVTKKKILIVDDEPELLEAIANDLIDAGFDTVGAKDGIDAIILSEKFKFDCIVSDINMPQMSGLSLAAALRGSKANENTPIFLMSAVYLDDHVAKAKDFSIACFLQKPFDTALLVSKLDEILKSVEDNSSLSRKFIEMFTASTLEILQFYFAKSRIEHRVVLHKEPISNNLSSGLINFAGSEFSGFFSFSVGQGITNQFAEAIFKDQRLHINEALITDITGEMANQIGGVLKTKMLAAGHALTYSLPLVIFGVGHKIIPKTNRSHVHLEFSIDQAVCGLDYYITAN